VSCSGENKRRSRSMLLESKTKRKQKESATLHPMMQAFILIFLMGFRRAPPD
jgi:hypothetical protein